MNINSEIVYRVYSIQELRSWLIDNLHNGLSEYAIAPVRAFALINNPCAKETDPAIVVAFDNDRPIGYSAVFPDDYVKGNTIGRLFLGTTEWIEPEYRGKGIAGKMMRALKDAVGIERYIGLESSIASVKLDQKQGAYIVMYNKVRFQFIATDSCKGYLNTKCIVYHKKKQLIRLSDYEYQNEYVNFVDAETYRFIESHAQQDLFLRQQEMFNWILRYPFMISTHYDAKAQKDICEFGGTVSEYKMEAIKVFVHNELVGFYIVSQTNKDRTLRYLYYEDGYIFTSLPEAHQKIKNDRFRFHKYAVLTADDGWASLKNILPWLNDQQIPITLFLNPAYLDGKHFRDRNTEKYLTEEEVQNLYTQYPLLTIGSHGWEHLDAKKQTPEEFEKSVTQSHEYLRRYPNYTPYFAIHGGNTIPRQKLYSLS